LDGEARELAGHDPTMQYALEIVVAVADNVRVTLGTVVTILKVTIPAVAPALNISEVMAVAVPPLPAVYENAENTVPR